MPSLVLYALLFMLIPVSGWAHAAPSAHTFTLQPGWNLISFPVLPEGDRSPAAVFGAMKRDQQPLYQADGFPPLSMVFAAGAGPAGRFPNDGTDCPTLPALASDCETDPDQTPPLPTSCPSEPLQQLEFGRAYWVYLEGINQGAKFTLQGQSAPPTPLNLAKANDQDNMWTGIGLTGVEDQSVNIQSFFGRSMFGNLVQATFRPVLGTVVKWDNNKKCFDYYYPEDPDGSDFKELELGQGYLVKVLRSPDKPFEPRLRVMQGTTELTHGGQQLTLPPTENELALDLLTAQGGAALTWQARLSPMKAPKPEETGLGQEDLPRVLSLVAETLENTRIADQPKSQTCAGAATTAKGIAFAELGNQLKIQVDRTCLPPGRYLTRLELEANTGEKRSYILEVSAAGLDGEWHGRATIDTVNGKSNPVPDVDLVLQLFRVEIGGQIQLRGLIDSQETLTLWPMDAQIIGYPKVPRSGSSLDNEFRNGFWLKAEYVLPPGDVNNYPYEYLKTDVRKVTDPITGLSYEMSAEGDRFYHQLAGRSKEQPNFLNPTIRFLRREIFLQGAITGVDMAGKSTVGGEYQETWTGLLPEAVTLKGTFTLTRENHLPLARRPFIFTADQGSISIDKPSKLLVNRALVLVIPDPNRRDLEGLRLIGPTDRMSYELACANQAKPEVVRGLLETPRIQGTPWQPMELEKRPARTALENRVNDYRVCELKELLKANTLMPVWGNPKVKGAWKLERDPSSASPSSASPERLDWALLLYGVPVHSVQGKVIVQGATGRKRFEDIDLQINGLGSDHRQWLKKILDFDPVKGSFTLDNLPGLHIQLIAQKPGYRDAVVDGLETENDPRGYRNGIRGILPGDPTLKEPPQANYTLTLKPLAE